ncbi:NAD-binding protein [Dermatophilaceae bacterium Soc4.6]
MAPDTDLPGGCLVVGDLEATRMTCRLLTESGHPVVHLTRPTDAAVRTALASPTGRAVATGISTVVVIVRSDVQALRWALLVEHIVPGIALVVSVFDRTVAQQLRRVVPHCLATSAAEVAAPAIVAAVTGDALAVLPDGRLLLAGSLGGPGEEALSTSRVQTAAFAPPTAPWWHHLTAWVPRRQEGSAALMLAGVTSLLAILVLDWALTVVVLHEPPLRALYAATRVVTTVGPADAVGHQPPGWYLVVAVVLMLSTLVATGSFVAGLVDWLRSSRSVGLLGRRSLPRSHHVVVAGLGQVGLRVSLLLRSLNVPVVVVEREADAPNLRLARAARIPVVIGHADDRAVMQRLGLPRALGLAALGSDELDNIAIAIAALAIAPDARVVVRAGEDDVIAETTSLFRIGRVVDVSALMALSVAATVGRRPPLVVFAQPGGVGLLGAQGPPVSSSSPQRCRCGEATASGG